MLKGEGSFQRYGNTYVIRVSPVVVRDSHWPFKVGDAVKVEIVNSKIIVTPTQLKTPIKFELKEKKG